MSSNAKRKKSTKISQNPIGNSTKRRRNKFGWKTIVTFIGVCGTVVTIFLGPSGIINYVQQFQANQCELAKFSEQNYQKAEKAFFNEFDSQPQSLPPNLWQNNGLPRPLAEVLVYKSPQLTNLKNAIINNQVVNPSNKLIFVYGSAGSGKSTVAKYLALNEDYATSVDLGKLRYNVSENRIHPMTKLVADLKIGDTIISEMADLKVKDNNKDFIQLLTEIGQKNVKNKKSVIIDGLDELHPHSSVYILRLAREYITKNPQQNLIFFGRGEAFRDYIEEYKDNTLSEGIYIEPVYLANKDMMRWYIANFLTYPKLEKNPQYLPNFTELNQEIDKRFQSLNNAFKVKPELRHFLQTAEPANILLRNLRYDAEQLSQYELLDLLKRNRRTHNRPSPDKSDTWLLYEKALIEAAKQLKPERRPDGKITAVVKPIEKIYLQHEGKCLSVEASQLLNRSGIVSLNPFNENQLEYIFQPMTIQKYLAKQKSISGNVNN